MRRGFTLFELLLVMCLMALVAGIAAPRVITVADRMVLQQEVTRLVVALDAARGAAMRLGAAANLSLTDSSYQVNATAGGEALRPWSASGAAARGVHLSGGGAPIQFGPSGIAMGASNRTLTLTRGGVTRSVVVSRLGRLSY